MRRARICAAILAAGLTAASAAGAQPPGAADSAVWRKAHVAAAPYEFVADTPEAAVFIDPSDEGYDPTGVPMEMNVRYEYFAAAPDRPELSARARLVFDCPGGRTRLLLTEYHAGRNLLGAARVARAAGGWTSPEPGALTGKLLAASCAIRAQMAAGER